MSARARELIASAGEAETLGDLLKQGIGGVLLGIGVALVSGILTLADLFIVPISAITSGVANVIGSVFGGSALIIDLGALETALSIGPGGDFALGPFSLAIAVASILLALYAINRYVAEESTGNLFPGLPFDIPTPGITDPEEEKKD